MSDTFRTAMEVGQSCISVHRELRWIRFVLLGDLDREGIDTTAMKDACKRASDAVADLKVELTRLFPDLDWDDLSRGGDGDE